MFLSFYLCIDFVSFEGKFLSHNKVLCIHVFIPVLFTSGPTLVRLFFCFRQDESLFSQREPKLHYTLFCKTCMTLGVKEMKLDV